MKTKDKIRCILIENSGKNVSGEFLACECGVSRAAIWKAVNSLREDGLKIEGTTNGGYRLLNAQDILSEATIRSDLQFFARGDGSGSCEDAGRGGEAGDGKSGACASGEKENLRNTAERLLHSKIQVFEEIDSTNSYAKRLLSEAGNLRDGEGNLTEAGKKLSNSIYIAEKQTAGRGRLGRTFYSPEKNGVYISMIYAPRGGIKNPALVTALAAVAVKRAIKTLYNLHVQIKWINDIFYNGKKLCGILAEGITNFESGLIEAAVVGIGLNVYSNFGGGIPDKDRSVIGSIQESLAGLEKQNLQKSAVTAENPEDLQNGVKSQASSLFRRKVAALIALEFFSIMEIISESENNLQNLMDEYQKASFLIGREVLVHPVAGAVTGAEKESYRAKVLGIDQSASLLVQLEDGSRKCLSSGEVSIGSGNV